MNLEYSGFVLSQFISGGRLKQQGDSSKGTPSSPLGTLVFTSYYTCRSIPASEDILFLLQRRGDIEETKMKNSDEVEEQVDSDTSDSDSEDE